MPTIRLTEYECEQDLLPPVCAKCGAPATEWVPRRVRYISNRLGWLPVAALVTSLFALPPLFLALGHRFGEAMWVRIPVCGDHRTHWGWRDQGLYLVLMPAWAVTVTSLNLVGLVVALLGGDPGVYLMLAVVALILTLIVENCVLAYGAVRLLRAENPPGVKVCGAHPEFVTALTLDRARDRVTNPDRRTEAGIGEDYDDEPI
ncbi:MAG TPA: hypothetical protein VKE40_14730 [Gemmataceae bacterium]|nr:hypothetical protein [Gemmataceae bacterium]